MIKDRIIVLNTEYCELRTDRLCPLSGEEWGIKSWTTVCLRKSGFWDRHRELREATAAVSVDWLVDNNELNISVQLCYSILRGVILIESNESDRFSFESIQRFGVASLIPWTPTRSTQVKLIDDSFVLTDDHVIITSSWRSYRGMEHTTYVEFCTYKIDWVVTMDKIWEIVLAMWSISTTILITSTSK